MDQLTQMELLQIQEHLGSEALAVKKCQLYSTKCTDQELQRVLSEAAKAHQRHLDTLIDELRKLSGKAEASHREH